MIYMLGGLLATALLGLDQWVKWWTVSHFTAPLPPHIYATADPARDLLPGLVDPCSQLWRGLVQPIRAAVAAGGADLPDLGGGPVCPGPANRPAPSGCAGRLSDSLGRLGECYRPGAAGLRGGHVSPPVLAILSRIQRGGHLRGVRRPFGGGVLPVVLRQI